MSPMSPPLDESGAHASETHGLLPDSLNQELTTELDVLVNIRRSRIPRGLIMTSAAKAVPADAVVAYAPLAMPPQVGDLVYGRVVLLGQHRELENRSGRIHRVNEGATAVFVYGNRYATDAYEALVPTEAIDRVDLVARSGVIGRVHTRASSVVAPTQIRVLGHLVDEHNRPLNTRQFRIEPPAGPPKTGRRAQLVLVVGTAMNAGKSTAAIAIAWALTSRGRKVRASKLTGTASLKEILYMEDAGATHCHDFTSLGWPSTYLLDEPELLEIFTTLDHRFANNASNHWVCEIADGLLQRETAILLANPNLRSRIDRLVLCAPDPFAALGGLATLRDRFGLEPDAISGIVGSSPLGVEELQAETTIPTFDAAEPNISVLADLLLDRP